SRESIAPDQRAGNPSPVSSRPEASEADYLARRLAPLDVRRPASAVEWANEHYPMVAQSAGSRCGPPWLLLFPHPRAPDPVYAEQPTRPAAWSRPALAECRAAAPRRQPTTRGDAQRRVRAAAIVRDPHAMYRSGGDSRRSCAYGSVGPVVA